MASNLFKQNPQRFEEVVPAIVGAYFDSGRCLRAQESRLCKTGRSFLPNGVREYSTRTGISGNISRLMMPARSSSLSC